MNCSKGLPLCLKLPGKSKVDNCYQLKYFDLIRMFHTDYDLVSISHIFYICYIFMPLKGLQLYQKIDIGD